MTYAQDDIGNTAKFLHALLSRPSLWDDGEVKAGLFALARKCDLAQTIYSEYGKSWKEPASASPMDLTGWELFVEALFKAVRTAPNVENAVKLLNSSANAVSTMQKRFAFNCAAAQERWHVLADGVFNERT